MKFIYLFLLIVLIQKINGYQIFFDNADNGHLYFINDTLYTFDDALKISGNPIIYNSLQYYGYPLVIESYKEYNYLSTQVFPNLPMTSDIWLGAIPLDQDQNQWGWMNGSSARQPFYSTYPERCFKFCADFTGNLNTSFTNLALNKNDMKWFGSKATDLKLVMIEYQLLKDTIVLENSDYPSPRLYYSPKGQTVTNMKVNGISVTSFSSGTNGVYSALLGGDYLSYRGDLTVLIYNAGTLLLNSTFQFNSPWVYAVQNISPNTYRVYGSSIDQIGVSLAYNPNPANYYIENSTISSFNYLPNNTIDLIFSQPLQKQYPIQLNNSQFYIVSHRPAIYEPNSQRYYSFFPKVYDFNVSQKILGNSTLFSDTAYMALGTTPEISNFIEQQFTSVYWTKVTVSNGKVYWNNVFYNNVSQVFLGVGNGYYYYDGVIEKKIIGLFTITNYVAPVNMSVVLVYGENPIKFTNPGSISTSIRGQLVSINMISNFMRPGTNTVKFKLFPSGVIGNGNLDIPNKKVSFQAPPQFGTQTAEITIGDEQFSTFQRSFNITLVYKAATITNITFSNGNLTVTGTDISNPVEILGVNCAYPYFTGLDKFTCIFQDEPGKTYQVSLKVGGITSSNTFDILVSGIYSSITKIQPKYVSLEGGTKITVSGYNFGTSPVFSIDNIGNIANIEYVNSTSYVLLIDYKLTSQFYITLSNTSYTVVQNTIDSITPISFKIYNITQDGYLNFTIFGDYLDIYYPTWDLKIDGQPLSNSFCFNSTYCTVQFPTTISNGYLTVYSKPTNPIYQFTYRQLFKPVLLGTTAPFIRVLSNMTFSTLFTNNNTYSIEFSNRYFLNLLKRDNFTLVVDSFPQWVGNYSIRAIDNIGYRYISKELYMVYSGPIINNVAYDNGTQQVVIDGLYLGFNDLATFPNKNITTPIISGLTESSIYPSNNTNFFNKLVIPIPNDARSGVLTLNVLNQTTTTTIYLPPNIYKTTNPPASGGAFTITGKYLNLFSFDSQPILEVYFNGESRPFNILDDKYPNVLEIIAQPGTGTGILLLKNPKYSKTIDVMYQNPTITSVSSTYFKESGDITIIGSNFVNSNFSVQLSNSSLTKECSNPTIDLSGTRIVCKFDSDIQSSTGTLFIIVTVGGQTIKSEKFIYYPPKAQCNGCVNGDCNNGFCQCKFGYIGVSCSQEIQNKDTKIIDVPQVKNDTINVVLGSNSKNVQFNISINSISERNPEDQIIKSYKFSEIKWVLQSNSDSKFNYIGTFDNDSNLEINVETTIITNNTEYNFVGDIFPLSNNSIKYLITISNWTFSNQLNKLELEFQSKSHSVQSECGGEIKPQFDTTTNSKSSLRTMEIKQGDIIMTAFFSDRMLIDESRLFYSEVSTTNHTDENGSLYVINTMSIPYFMNSVLLDPSFGALVIFDNEAIKCSVKNNWKLPVIIVCSIVGAAVISTLAFIYLKKRYRYQFKLASIKLKNISRSDKYR